jgi:hypothetical protein
VQDLRFYPTFNLTSYPATVSWQGTLDSKVSKSKTKAKAVVKESAFVLVLQVQFPQSNTKRGR